MFGFSIFLNEDLSKETETYIEQMAKHGFSGIFTSLHIPEDDVARYRERLSVLGGLAKRHNLQLMVDISGEALQRAGFSFDHPEELLAIGVTGLRMDDHITNQTIARLSKMITVALNASTIVETDIQALQAAQANFQQIEAWHNYYPRPETGLDLRWYCAKNQWLKQQGLTIQAFVPGDEGLRGPIFAGLPTLEGHREQHPLASALDLQSTTDHVYIGDSRLSARSMRQFAAYLKEQVIVLAAESYDAQFEYVLGEHRNRLDEARDVVRSANARFQPIPDVSPRPPQVREKGAITLDNQRYLRYMGEIQVVKHPLPADERVNVVGRVCSKDQALITYIRGGQKFRIESEKQQ